MSDHPTGPRLETASVTDRGLNERRPLNEDSLLCEPGLSVFAVADGVGGAEAGEVASQTAIEVLAEAFRHHRAGEDAEDLMEIAIQRANDSIYRLSREEPRFSMMATTIVALHLDGARATVGHVGDSRLYSFTPAGGLRRETEDHSLVEEEVRAGRMTAAQAANHPSRNVISRALGAEAAVEVDLRTFEFDGETTFLLCSDGITRHIPDQELSALLSNAPDLEAACAEMKRLCFERGAEDNLTAVLVRAGAASAGAAAAGGGAHIEEDDEVPTLVSQRPSLRAEAAEASAGGQTRLRRPFNDVGVAAAAASAPGANGPAPAAADGAHAPAAAPPAEQRGGGARLLGLLLLLVGVGAAAFYGGLIFGRQDTERAAGAAATPAANLAPGTPAATQTPAALGQSAAAPGSFEERRRVVDRSPVAEALRMAQELSGQPLTSPDPEFLYLYGRALLLTDRPEEAVAAFNRAVQRIDENTTPENAQLKIDALVASAAAHLRAGRPEEARGVAQTLDGVVRKEAPAPAGMETPPAGPAATP